MKFLILDTCGPSASFALVDTADSQHQVHTLEGRSVSERLLLELRAALLDQRWNLRDMDAIAAVSGPGSFTGTRIGLAVAKGLCEAAARPLVLLSRLAVLAHKGAISWQDEDKEETVHALLSAGRREFFYGRKGLKTEDRIESLLGRDAVLAGTYSGLVVACEPEVQEAFPERIVLITEPLTAIDAFPLVIRRVEGGSFDDIAGSDGNYVRRTDAEVLERIGRRSGPA